MGKRRADDPNCPVCVYCGVAPGTENEHVIAKGFFPAPRPPKSEFILVPACPDCNRGRWKDSDTSMSMDEEYARTWLSMELNAGNHPAAKALAAHDAEIARSMRNSEGLRKKIVGSITRRPMLRESGILVPNASAISFDGPRFRRVMRKIVMGLYYHELGQRLPDGFEVVVEALQIASEGFAPTSNIDSLVVRTLASETFVAGPRRLGGGVFSYAFRATEDDPPAAVWVFSFYDAIYSLIATRPVSTMATPLPPKPL